MPEHRHKREKRYRNERSASPRSSDRNENPRRELSYDRKDRTGSAEGNKHRITDRLIRLDSPDQYSRQKANRSPSSSPKRRTGHPRRHKGDQKVRRSRSPQSRIQRSDHPLPSQQAAFHSDSKDLSSPSAREKEKPNYKPSGLLAAETNKVENTDVVLKYNEPPESRLPPPSQPWRLYIFKSQDLLDTVPLSTRPCWLFGRESAVADVAIEHPSCSKQHAVLQFRYVEKVVGDFGEKNGGVCLYLIDLESANGTRLNGDLIPKRRFVECKTGDIITFGDSVREYVVLLPPKD